MKNKWSLVIHDVGQTYVNIWVGTLFPDLRKPQTCSVDIFDINNQLIESIHINKEDWQRPFTKVNDRFYSYVTFKNLIANQYYQVKFIRHQQTIKNIILEERVLSNGKFYTLPTKLTNEHPFVIATGSCFYNEEDNGAAANAYTSLFLSNEEQHKPHIKFLTGDQVYLDIGLDSLSPIVKDVRKRIADDYAITWQAQRQMLRHGATWFLADDHEYWNNFPYTSGKNPYLWAITSFKNIKRAWTETAYSAVKNIQKVSLFKTLDIGNDLSICFVDLRSHRDKGDNPKKMLPTKEFKQLLNWASHLTTPGVIVLPQPLLVKPGGELDLNLANFTEQYSQLINALASSGHDIVCLSGDVHFGRIASVRLGNKGAQLHEIISSPMSNLTGLDGKVAASSPKKLSCFPSFAIDGISQETIQYKSEWAVTTQKIKFLGLFSYRKTKEHFMTLSFKKDLENNIQLDVQAWRIRESNKRTGLPKKEFKNSQQFILR